MHFCLVKMTPEGTRITHGLDDVILPMQFALMRLGYSVEIYNNSFNPDCVNIFFGSCQAPLALDDPPVPAGSIVFNLEQLAAEGSPWNNRRYVDFQLRRFTVWDYSRRNVAHLEGLGIESTFVQLGYVPEMTRLEENFPRDIDVLFYGGINERRQAVLDQLSKAGVRLGILRDAFGTDRDYAIARARLIVNVHYYTHAVLELPRLGYLFANRKPVVSELGPETEQFPGLEDAAAYCEYEAIVPTVLAHLKSQAALDARSRAGYAAFSALRQEDILEAIVGRRNFASAALPVPPVLQAGAGSDFRYECLNVDIDPNMTPDIVLDLSAPLDTAAEHDTLRFGKIRLQPGYFLKIRAFDVLEHVADLPATMRNFLDLLRVGGELELMVPYDLSLGAWQDPTHVRGFNENSWMYYAEDSWRLGWRDHCFDAVFVDYVLSELGTALKDGGAPLEELIRTPRAVDSLHVVLRKRKKTPEEHETFDLKTRTFYSGAAGEWSAG